jgi:hypothetical protein
MSEKKQERERNGIMKRNRVLAGVLAAMLLVGGSTTTVFASTDTTTITQSELELAQELAGEDIDWGTVSDVKLAMNLNSMAIMLTYWDVVYDGTQKHPEVYFPDYPDAVLGVDYSVSYQEGCIEPGRYSVYIKGLTGPCNIRGEGAMTFKIMTQEDYDKKYGTGSSSSTTSGSDSTTTNTNTGTTNTGSSTTTTTTKKQTQSLTVSIPSKTVTLGSKPQITVKDAVGTVTYSSSNERVATVDSNGKISLVNSGYTTIKVTASGDSSYKAASKSFNLKVLPETPTPTVTNTSSGVKISWEPTKGASTGYIIYRSGEKLATVSGSKASYYIDKTATTNGKKYSYQVVGYVKGSAETLSSPRSSKVFTYILTKPTIESAKNSSAGKIKVTWKKNGKATGYQVKISNDDMSTTYTIKKNTTLSKTISGLTKGDKYKISIRSYKTDENGKKYYSLWSAVDTVTVS